MKKGLLKIFVVILIGLITNLLFIKLVNEYYEIKLVGHVLTILIFIFLPFFSFMRIYSTNKKLVSYIKGGKAIPDELLNKYGDNIPEFKIRNLENTGNIALAFSFLWFLLVVFLIFDEQSIFFNYPD